MTGSERFATMRRVNRRTAAWCSGLLVIVQMVTGPVAHPMPGPMQAADCQHAVAPGTPHGDADCGDCPSAADHFPAGSKPDQPTTRTHCACACPCGHTPLLASPTVPVLKPALPADVRSEPKGPTFSPPLFDFLRPPN